ncbi:MAG TPA: universal stress protein, partial [Acidimicrobiales bacterium]
MTTTTPHGLVVGYDGSSDAQNALDWATRTASLANEPLTVVVATATDDLMPEHALISGGHLDEVVSAATDSLGQTPLSDAVVETRPGPAVPVLLDAASKASALVVGSRGYGQVAGMLNGSVSQHVARHAACPVVVVRPSAKPQSRRIVVGVDGSEASAAAAEFACRRAALTGEDVVVIHGWRDGRATGTTRREIPPGFMERIAREERLLGAAVADLRQRHPEVRIEAEAIPVVGWRALADASATASLVVVGSRGRGAFTGMLLG